ncbi:MAG TPA: carboxylesterase/lipase family protein [Kofleriaceae bacterium]|nr:carboxylesterase/lipase family protein [Kofleriaceae bacterium]
MVNLVVETSHGKVRGEVRSDVAMWKGIPFAAPPVGRLRFRPPEPPVAWRGERDATSFGPVAQQSRSSQIALLSGVTEKVLADEDCLQLNVFAPAGPDVSPADKHPVMVWIHGGAFVMGSGSTPLYHGDPFVADGIIVVTINYRLGIPGFLYLGGLGDPRAPGNVALLDQIAALRWVQSNIAAFGGDPDNVTVMGESAGAISIGTLLAMPEARGLFHRAILESGASGLGLPTRDEAARIARGVVEELGVTAAGLADVPIEQLIAAQERLSREHGLAAFSPYLDGTTIARRPIEAIRDGAAAGIPLLLGTNRDEWNLFEVFLGEVTIAPFKEPVRAWLGPTLDELLHVYRARHFDPRALIQGGGNGSPGATGEIPRPIDPSDTRAWVDLIGDLVFRIPAIRTAEAQAAHGTPVYMYRFGWASPTFGGRLGAAHALELAFVWNRLDLPMAPILLGKDPSVALPLATIIHATWAQFIKTGDPNGAGLPEWPRYDAERRATMLLDRTCTVADDPGGEARVLWPEFDQPPL